MGIRFLDLDSVAREVIGQLVTVREPTMCGLGPDEPISGIRPRLLPVASGLGAPGPASPQQFRRRQPSIPFYLVTRKKPATEPELGELHEPFELRAVRPRPRSHSAQKQGWWSPSPR
jgi:hypothetical protein